MTFDEIVDAIGIEPYYREPAGVIFNCDCRDLGPKLPKGISPLIIADPPYGMGKEKDGVANDNLYGPKLDAFQMEWWSAFRPALTDNASAYIFGNAKDLWRLWYVGGLCESERITFRNQIIWVRGAFGSGGGTGVGQPIQRSYFPETEHILFFMLGEQGFNTNADNYWEGWEPIREYLDDERQQAGLLKRDIDRAWCKYKNVKQTAQSQKWFSISCFGLPTEENYKWLQQLANGLAFNREYDDLKQEYDDLKREYDDLKQEWYATRAYFDNTHDNMTDVWNYPRAKGSDRCGHPTPKPVNMMARIIKSSSREGDIVIDPLMGEGPVCRAAKQLKRNYIACEIDEKYCQVGVQRLAQEELF